MSSFICSPKTFNSLELSIKQLAYGSEFSFPYSLNNSFPALYNRSAAMDAKDAEISGVLDTMRELNVLCVSLQYKHHYEGKLDAEIKDQYNYLMTNKNSAKSLSKVAIFKNINCVIYQIETDHLKELRDLTAEENKALLFMKELSISLAIDIVCDLPEYDKAPYGID